MPIDKEFGEDSSGKQNLLSANQVKLLHYPNNTINNILSDNCQRIFSCMIRQRTDIQPESKILKNGYVRLLEVIREKVD